MAYRFTLTNLDTLDTEVLTNDPVGWQDSTYSIKRSEKYRGIMHEFTSPLKFHCRGGGKQFIDAVYADKEVDGRIDILVEYSCDGGITYDEVFNGIVNLASYSIEGDFTVCSIERSDLMTKFISRDEISVDLETNTSIGGQSITAVPSKTVTLEAVAVPYLSSWEIADGHIFGGTYNKGSLTDLVRDNWVQLAMTTSTTEIVSTFASNDLFDEHILPDNFPQSNVSPIITANDNGILYPLNVDWNINWKGTYRDTNNITDARKNIRSRLLLIFGKKPEINVSSGPNFIILKDYTGYTSDNFTDDFEIVDSGSFALNQDESVWLVWQINDQDVDGPGVVVNYTIEIEFTANSTFSLSATTTSETSQAKTILVHEAFNAVVDAIADSDGNFFSEFFGREDSDKQTYDVDGCGSLAGITNGLNIREYLRPIHCSFNQLFSAMDCVHNLGAGYLNGKIRVEPLSFWFDPTNKIISLPHVNTYTMRDVNALYYNKIDIGYSKWEAEFRGGLDDVNTRHEYSTKVASVNGVYQKICTFITSAYAIEFTRRKNAAISKNEDWRYDNDNFLIALKRATYIEFTGEVYSDSFNSGTGYNVLQTAYNMRYTPKRMLLAHLNAITAGLQRIQGAIKFIKAAGNSLLSVATDSSTCQADYNGQPLAENSNINWNDANAQNAVPLWRPRVYEFEYPLTYQQFKTIKNNPTGYIEFYRFDDEVKNGYIQSVDFNLFTGLAQFKLLEANI